MDGSIESALSNKGSTIKIILLFKPLILNTLRTTTLPKLKKKNEKNNRDTGCIGIGI